MFVYFDNAATTKPCAAAVDAFTAALGRDGFGNPSSLHDAGIAAEHTVSDARAAVAELLGLRGVSAANPLVYFTSGGTEGNNTLISGVLERYRGKCASVVTSAAEHPSVDECLKYWETQGVTVARVPSKSGCVDAADVAAAVRDDTVLVTVMAVNNETGAVNDTRAIFSAARSVKSDILCHTDATQAFGKLPFTVKSSGADMLTVSAHKIGGFKGTGAVYIDPKLITAKRVRPLLFGGGQERGVRSGTENTPGIAAFGAAAHALNGKIEDNLRRAGELYAMLTSAAEGLGRVNRPREYSPYILSLTLPFARSEIILQYLSSAGIYVSSGSACSSHSAKRASRALLDFGLSAADADRTIRISASPENTAADVEKLADALKTAAARFK